MRKSRKSGSVGGESREGLVYPTISDHYEQFNQNSRPEQQYSKIMPAELGQLELPGYSEGFDELYYIEHMGNYHRDGDTSAMMKRDWSDTL